MKEQILIEATKKLISLREKEEWKNELLDKAPPVLWFGNLNSDKPKILTIGANPSRWEFLDRKEMKSCLKPFKKDCYEDKYLSEVRFTHLMNNQNYEDILNSKELRKEIIKSYNNYFGTNPYKKWFGLNKPDAYNCEGVLRGMDASYYENDTKYRACHIDLFPFATVSNFNEITKITEQDILNDFWAKNLVDELLTLFKPKVILVFGKENYKYFYKYFNLKNGKEEIIQDKQGQNRRIHYDLTYNAIKVIGLSINLGNPTGGFKAKDLNRLGEKLKQMTGI